MKLASFVIGTVLYAIGGLAAAAGYKITPLGGENSSAHAINAAGDVVGNSMFVKDGFGHQRATLWQDGTLVDLGSVEGTSSHAYGISNNGRVVGTSRIRPAVLDEMAAGWLERTPRRLPGLGGNWSQARAISPSGRVVVGWSATNGGGGHHAARWDQAGVRDLGTLGGNMSYAMGVNNAGQVVGYSWTTSVEWQEHATLWGTDLAPVDLGTLGGRHSHAFAINASGVIVGSSELAPGSSDGHAVKWVGQSIIDLGTLGGPHSVAYGINRDGVIVGASQDWAWAVHAAVWDGNLHVDLNDHLDAAMKEEGWELQSATAINDRGQIVCNGYSFRLGTSQTFLATPMGP